MFRRSIERLWAHLPLRRKRQLAILLGLMVITSLAEVVSIGAVLPFLAALISPEKVFSSVYVQPIIANLGMTEPHQLVFLMTVCFVLAAIFSATIRITLIWAQTRLGHAIGADISLQIYSRTLYQPYAVHASRSSNEIISGTLSKVNAVLSGCILPMLNTVSCVLIVTAILIALVTIDAALALIAFGSFGAVYSIIAIVSRRRLTLNSLYISRESNRLVKVLQEGLGGIRDVLIDGTQSIYCKIYQVSDLRLRRAQANSQIISSSPRFLVESLGIAFIATLAFILTSREGGVATAMPLLGMLALGAQRLLPIFQQLYASWSSFRGTHASLVDVLDLLEQPLPAYLTTSASNSLSFRKSIKLGNIKFRYSKQTPWVLQEINLEVSKGARVGITGATGTGKSTLLDILLGLLLPQEGSMSIDGVTITEKNFRAWQAHISHVPQSIFLADATIAENIAFGIPIEKIDHERVREAAHLAQIAETVESWAGRYNTLAGERGVRLSGGQRQRIGIARALYKETDILVFDEATSALDRTTESKVMNAIYEIGSDVTVLIVAHRLSTLKFCDVIYELEAGRVKRQGTYDELFPNEHLRELG